MWFKKAAPVVCAVCGKAIGVSERRFVDKNRTTKAERHTHIDCANLQQVTTRSGTESSPRAF